LLTSWVGGVELLYRPFLPQAASLGYGRYGLIVLISLAGKALAKELKRPFPQWRKMKKVRIAG